MTELTATQREPKTDEDALVDRWRDLLACHASVSCALEKALQDNHGIGVSEFETLDRLAESAHSKQKMSDLGKDIYLSQSALSRAVARLENDKLVERTMCENDRRAIFVKLTESGRKAHEAAVVTHRAVLAETLR
jgi:DNA-binding MarR family transcriptional regulator